MGQRAYIGPRSRIKLCGSKTLCCQLEEGESAFGDFGVDVGQRIVLAEDGRRGAGMESGCSARSRTAADAPEKKQLAAI